MTPTAAEQEALDAMERRVLARMRADLESDDGPRVIAGTPAVALVCAVAVGGMLWVLAVTWGAAP